MSKDIKRYGIQIQAKSDTDPLNGQMVKLNDAGALYNRDKAWVEAQAAHQNKKWGGGFYHFEVVEAPEVA